MPPQPQPLSPPSSCPIVVPNVGVIGTGAGNPLYWQITTTTGTGIFWWRGQNLTFHVRSDSPTNLGIYGPNPQVLGIGLDGKTSGQMRAPKINTPDATVYQCQGNFTPGVYYLVVRSGADGPPVGNVEIFITATGWQVFG